jgi:hypothetical protein
VDGRRIIVRNISGFVLSLLHQGLGSSAANRIVCERAADIAVMPDMLAELIYDATTQRWVAALLSNRIIVGAQGSVLLNVTGSALATGATAGFTFIPSCAGTPTGTPTAHTGMTPYVHDSTNGILYAYSGGAWNIVIPSVLQLTRLGIGAAADGTAPLRVVGGEILQETAANGAVWKRGYATEEITIAATASTDSAADLLPADAIIEAVVVRVTVVIPTATSFKVGDASVAERFIGTTLGGGVSTAAGSTGTGLNQWKGSIASDAGGPSQATAAKVRITPNATPGAATGKVRVTVFYRTFTVPTS